MENIEALNKAINSLSKTSGIMDSFSLKIVSASKNIDDSRTQLSDEIILLRSCNENIENTISKSVIESANHFADRTSTLLKPFLNDQTEKLTQIIRNLDQNQENFLNILRTEHTRQRGKLSKVGFTLCLSFCLGSLLSGASLWYFFPQSTTHTIAFTPEQRKHMEHGTLLSFALPKMSKKEQEKIGSLMGDSWKEYYEKMFNVKIPQKKGQ